MMTKFDVPAAWRRRAPWAGQGADAPIPGRGRPRSAIARCHCQSGPAANPAAAQEALSCTHAPTRRVVVIVPRRCWCALERSISLGPGPGPHGCCSARSGTAMDLGLDSTEPARRLLVDYFRVLRWSLVLFLVRILQPCRRGCPHMCQWGVGGNLKPARLKAGSIRMAPDFGRVINLT